MAGSVRARGVPSKNASQYKTGLVVLHSWIFLISRFLGLWPFDSGGVFRKAAFFRGVCSVSVPICVFSYTRIVRLFRILNGPDEGIELTKHLLGTFFEIVMFLGSAVQAYVVFDRRKPIKVIVRCLADTKIASKAINYCFWATLSAQLASCYLAYVTFIEISRTAVIGSMNLIFVATMNYIFILQFCALSLGFENMIRLETARLKRQIVLTRQAALLELCRSTNSTYRKQILLSLTQIFGYLVSYFYNLIIGLVKEENIFEYVLFLFLNVAVRFSMLMLISYCSERLKIEAEAFNAELFKLMRDNSELCKNKKLRLYVTMKQTVNFTACGFFDLGYPLVTSIIAAATTYLVILIQFSI